MASKKEKPVPESSPETIRIPAALAPELRIFLFEPGTFILSRERLKLAGMSDSQIKGTEELYAQAIKRLQSAEESGARIQENDGGLTVMLPKLDSTMAEDFDSGLAEIAGTDLAAVIGPNLKRAEVLNGFGETERQYKIQVLRDANGSALGAKIFSETWTADGSGVQSSTISENFFSQRYPTLWVQLSSKLGLAESSARR